MGTSKNNSRACALPIGSSEREKNSICLYTKIVVAIFLHLLTSWKSFSNPGKDFRYPVLRKIAEEEVVVVVVLVTVT